VFIVYWGLSCVRPFLQPGQLILCKLLGSVVSISRAKARWFYQIECLLTCVLAQVENYDRFGRLLSTPRLILTGTEHTVKSRAQVRTGAKSWVLNEICVVDFVFL
jgi:hypothetical protein